MATVNAIITRARDALDEPTAAQWSNTVLKRWLNQGVNDIATVAKPFEATVDLAVVAATNEYTATATIVQIHHCYFLPTSSPTMAIPLRATHWDGMDQQWGSWQNFNQGDPQSFATWGYSPNLKIRLYPTPSRAGTLRVYHAKQPTPVTEDESTDNSTLDVPDFWTEAIVYYIEMRARRRDQDPHFREAQEAYNEKRQQLIDFDAMSATREMVYDVSAGGVPPWLANPDYPM